MNNYFKQLKDDTITGLKILLNNYAIHLIEGEQASVVKMLKNLSAQLQGPTPFYS